MLFFFFFFCSCHLWNKDKVSITAAKTFGSTGACERDWPAAHMSPSSSLSTATGLWLISACSRSPGPDLPISELTLDSITDRSVSLVVCFYPISSDTDESLAFIHFWVFSKYISGSKYQKNNNSKLRILALKQRLKLLKSFEIPDTLKFQIKQFLYLG